MSKHNYFLGELDQSAKDLFSYIRRLHSPQNKSFSQQIEFAVFDKKGYMRLFGDRLIIRAIQNASLVVVFNPDRAKRPKFIHAKRSVLSGSRPSFNWQGPSGNKWSIFANKYPILPQNLSKKTDMQPFNCIVGRNDRIVHQREMLKYKNIFDVLSLFIQINKSTSLKRKAKFRLGINGWYYSSARKETRTATLAQAHAQLIRFDFPIERASVKREDSFKGIVISTLADYRCQWGTGFVLEASASRLNLVSRLVSLILREVVRDGNSFSLFVAPAKKDKVRLFIIGRLKASPLPYFKNGWSFSEIARVPIVTYPDDFWANSSLRLVKKDLWERTQISLQEITLPQDKVMEFWKRIIEGADLSH